jgi:hypothetical protein
VHRKKLRRQNGRSCSLRRASEFCLFVERH